jgi:hypothetical protein
MNHTLTIELPEEVFEPLEKRSVERGIRPQELVLTWVRQQIEAEETAYPVTLETDPLARFIGAFDSGLPDLARRHDEYLAEAYQETHDHDSR